MIFLSSSDFDASNNIINIVTESLHGKQKELTMLHRRPANLDAGSKSATFSLRDSPKVFSGMTARGSATGEDPAAFARRGANTVVSRSGPCPSSGTL